MATTVITKSSLNVVGGGTISTTGTPTLFTTASNQYAILNVTTDANNLNSINIGAITTALVPQYATQTYYIPPSTTVTVRGNGGGTYLAALWTIFQNT